MRDQVTKNLAYKRSLFILYTDKKKHVTLPVLLEPRKAAVRKQRVSVVAVSYLAGRPCVQILIRGRGS